MSPSINVQTWLSGFLVATVKFHAERNLQGWNDAATADAGLRACKAAAARLLCVLLHSMCMCVVGDAIVRGKGSYHYI